MPFPMDSEAFFQGQYAYFANNKISNEYISVSTVNYSHNGPTFHSQPDQQVLHDACYACDSPECGEEPACPGIQVECYDTNCLEDATQLCGDEFCAGPLAPNELNGAHVLVQLSGSNLTHVGHGISDHYNMSTYPGGQPNMDGANLQYNNNLCADTLQHADYNNMCSGHMPADCGIYGVGGQMCQFDTVNNSCNPHQHPIYSGHGTNSHINTGSTFCQDPMTCPLQTQFPYNDLWDSFQGCQHFPMVDNNIDYHNWQHHQQQFGPHGCGAASISQQPVLDLPDSLFRSFSNGSDDTTPRNSDMTSHHGRHYTSTPLTSGQGSPALDSPSDPEAPYYCKWFIGAENDTTTTCDEKFMTTKALQEHVEEKHCNVLSKAKDGFFCRWEGCDRLACPQNKAFAQKSKLERHVQKHTGYKSQVCTICNNRYATAQTLAQHMKTHNDPAACKCDLLNTDGTPCTYTTAQASQLTMHKRTIHLNVKPLACKFPGCGATFSESSNLSKHNKTHLPVGDFYCGCCGKRFDREDQVKRHWKKHLMEESNAIEVQRKLLRSKGMLESDILKLGLAELLERSPIKKQAVILKRPLLDGNVKAMNQCKRPHAVPLRRRDGQSMNENHPNAVLEREMTRVVGTV